MDVYLKRPRRIIGIAALALACAFTAAWIRSFLVADIAGYQDYRYYIHSNRGQFAVGSDTGSRSITSPANSLFWNSTDSYPRESGAMPDWKWNGIEWFSAGGTWWVAVSYWMITTPLILLSGLLLLTRPGKLLFRRTELPTESHSNIGQSLAVQIRDSNSETPQHRPPHW